MVRATDWMSFSEIWGSSIAKAQISSILGHIVNGVSSLTISLIWFCFGEALRGAVPVISVYFYTANLGKSWIIFSRQLAFRVLGGRIAGSLIVPPVVFCCKGRTAVHAGARMLVSRIVGGPTGNILGLIPFDCWWVPPKAFGQTMGYWAFYPMGGKGSFGWDLPPKLRFCWAGQMVGLHEFLNWAQNDGPMCDRVFGLRNLGLVTALKLYEIPVFCSSAEAAGFGALNCHSFC
ncbi:hypothetical protein U1Q18_036461 [Sarracenia purpurea var. burkii]